MATTGVSATTDPWATLITQIVDLVHGTNGTEGDRANQVADIADPFRKERAGYQDQLRGLLTDPSSFKVDAGTQYSIDQGNDAITRAANAQGVSRGGSVVSDIGKNVTGQSQAAYSNRINQLLAASGATTGSPAAAALAVQQGQQAGDKDLTSGISGVSSLIPSIISMIKGAVGGGSGGGLSPLPNIGDPGSTLPLIPDPGDGTPMLPGPTDDTIGPDDSWDWGSIFNGDDSGDGIFPV
jgi:hypothetical protein